MDYAGPPGGLERLFHQYDVIRSHPVPAPTPEAPDPENDAGPQDEPPWWSPELENQPAEQNQADNGQYTGNLGFEMGRAGAGLGAAAAAGGILHHAGELAAEAGGAETAREGAYLLGGAARRFGASTLGQGLGAGLGGEASEALLLRAAPALAETPLAPLVVAGGAVAGASMLMSQAGQQTGDLLEAAGVPADKAKALIGWDDPFGHDFMLEQAKKQYYEDQAAKRPKKVINHGYWVENAKPYGGSGWFGAGPW